MSRKAKKKDLGTDASRRWFGFQKELLGFILEQDEKFVPKWLAFIKGCNTDRLKTQKYKIIARPYTKEERKIRFTN
jgi:hypothetical protein